MCYTFFITHAQYLFYFYENVIMKTNETYANGTKACPRNYRFTRTRILNNASLKKCYRGKERGRNNMSKRERNRGKVHMLMGI